jgi:P-type Ca2+ transporter type 2C
MDDTPGVSRITAHQLSVEDVLRELGTDSRVGLSDEEARTRLERFGRNELAKDRPAPAWKKFLAQFRDVLVILLLVATAISAGLWLVEGETPLPFEAIAIFAVVVVNAVIGYVQESRAESAVASVRASSRPRSCQATFCSWKKAIRSPLTRASFTRRRSRRRRRH